MADLSPKLCSRYHHAVELLGRRWAGAIVRILLDGPARYNELRAAIPDINDRMLAERLRELECEGVLSRTVLPDPPVRVEYALTDKGRGLEASITALGRWAEKWLPAPEPAAARPSAARPSGRGRTTRPAATTGRTRASAKRA